MGAAMGIVISTATWLLHKVLQRILEVIRDARGRDDDHKLNIEEALAKLDERLEEQLDKLDFAACVDLLRGLGPKDDDEWPQKAIDEAKHGRDPLEMLHEALGDEDYESIFEPFYSPFEAVGNQEIADLESKMYRHVGESVSSTCRLLLARGS